MQEICDDIYTDFIFKQIISYVDWIHPFAYGDKIHFENSQITETRPTQLLTLYLSRFENYKIDKVTCSQSLSQ